MNSLLLCALALTIPAPQNQGEPIKLLRTPAVHGSQLVFNYAGDLWTSDLSGGLARRLTSYPTNEANPVFSPDGNWVAFTAAYDGSPDVYVIPSEGGQPQRVTFDGRGSTVLFWKDSDTLAVSNPGKSRSGFTSPLAFVPRTGGIPVNTAVQEISTGSMSGSLLAYNRHASQNFNWRRYRGGTQGMVSFYNLATNTYSELPHGREQNYFPMIVGKDVYYISDKEQGTLNLYKAGLDNRKATQLTHFDDMDIKSPSTDGKTIVFERGSVVYAYDIASGKVNAVNPRVVGDINPIRPILKKVIGNLGGLSISPSGARVAIDARGDIFTVPAKGGETRNLTESQGVRERFPSWSPDGQKIAYASDKSGEYHIYVMGQRGGDVKEITTGNLKIDGMDWMPDNKTLLVMTFDQKIYLVDTETKKQTLVRGSKFGFGGVDVSPLGDLIVFTEVMDNLYGATFIYDVKSGATKQITDGFYNDGSVAFDRSGKYLYLASNRTFNFRPSSTEIDMGIAPGVRVYMIPLKKDTPNPLAPKEEDEPLAAKPDAAKKDEPKKDEPKKDDAKRTEIDYDGLDKRLIALPFGPSSIGNLVGDDNGVYAVVDDALMSFSLRTRQPAMVLPAGSFNGLSFNATRSKVAIAFPGGLAVSDVRPEINPAQAAVNTSDVEMMVDPRAEWKQIITDAWRLYRDKFYDPNMVGVDWNVVKARYEAMVPYCTTRADVNYVLGMMVGEVGTGHAYVTGGDGWPVATPSVAVGSLAADFVVEGDAVKISHIYVGKGTDRGTRGPLAEPGVNVPVGSYILEMGGKKVNAQNPPAKYLANKVGKPVVLTIADSAAGANKRAVTVRPISDDRSLRYEDWVSGNRALVSKLSGGAIGYFHVPDTSAPGIMGFQEGYYASSGNKAVVVDERFNGGGFIPTFFQERLMRKVQAAMVPRDSGMVNFPSQSITTPTCLLINEYAGSGGDMFPWLYAKNKIGPLIGKRTWGGLVGIAGFQPLVDGGGVSVPSFGIYDPEKGEWVAENKGIDPDIDIDARPDLVAAGRDPQLEKAVEVLLAEIKKNKGTGKVPPFPNVKKRG